MLSLLLASALLTSTPVLPPDAPVIVPVAPQREVPARAKWIALGGSALLVTGVTLWIVGGVQHANAGRAGLEPEALAHAQENALHNTLGGIGLTVVGACGLWIAAELWSWIEAPVALSTFLTAQGGGVTVVGRLP